MNQIKLFLAYLIAIGGVVVVAPAQISEAGSSVAQLRSQLPIIPNRTVEITQFGAVADGRTLNHTQIQKAIDHVAGQGGGRVVIPPGIWLSGPIELKSKVELHLQEGALLIFAPKFELYPDRHIVLNGVTQTITLPPIFGDGLHDVAITGRGVIDGSGHAWRPVKKSKMTERQWRDLIASGGKVIDGKDPVWLPATEREAERRPKLLKLVNCKRVLLEGVTFQNSPNWNLNPTACENVTLRNVTVRNPWYSQNGDGLDIEHCRFVVVEDCRFDVGDDAICLKSGLDAEGRAIGLPTEHVRIRNCVVYHGHGGVTIGSEMSGGVRFVWVDNCTLIGTDMGLRFKSQRGRGGTVENIYFNNIRMIDIPTDAIGFDMFYGGAAPRESGPDGMPAGEAALKPDETTPVFRNIFFQNIICRGARRAIGIRGLPEMPIQKIVFRDVTISAKTGVQLEHVKDITFENVEIDTPASPTVSIANGFGVSMSGFKFPPGAPVAVQVAGSASGDIVIKGADTNLLTGRIKLGAGVNADAVRVTP